MATDPSLRIGSIPTTGIDPAASPPAGALTQALISSRDDSGTLALLTLGADEAGAAGAGDSPNGYEILGELGRGGMGVVYRARQTKLQRIVALKMILSGGHASRRDLERFRTEAEAIGRLQHPHIVQIHEVGEHHGLPYFALEFCGGGSLEKKLAGTPLAPGEAAALVEKLGRAMQAAHDKGVIHRDLKPANVLLADDGTPKITDFGLAKKLDEAGQTQSGAVMGTPSYMAPEQARGHNKELSPACDVYALGAVLYCCLTGRPPFRAASPLDTVLQVMNEEPVPVTRLNVHVPRDLETICLKCLQKEPHKRYGSAAALADDLSRFLRGESVLARPVGRAEQLLRWCRREPALAGSLAAAFLILLVGIVVSTCLGITAYLTALAEADARKTADAARQTAETAEREAKTAKDNALTKLWDSYLQQARGLRNARRPGQRFATLRAIRAALALPVPPGRSKDELRTEAIAALLLPDFDVVQEWNGFPPGSTGFALDRTFERYARGDASGTVSIRRVKGDVELWQLPAIPGTTRINSYYGLDFSPDGRFFNQGAVTPQGDRKRLWKLDGPKPVIVLEGDYHGYAFSPDSRQFAAIFPDNSVRRFDLETSQEVKRYQPPRGAWHVRWNPQQRLLVVGQDNGYWLLNLETGQGRAAVLPGKITWFDWHPEGRVLAVAANADGSLPAITLHDVASGQQVLAPLEGHKTGGVMMCFSHAGDRLLSTDWNGIWRLWDVKTGQMLLTMPSGGTSSALQSRRPPGRRRFLADQGPAVPLPRRPGVPHRRPAWQGRFGRLSSVGHSPPGTRGPPGGRIRPGWHGGGGRGARGGNRAVAAAELPGPGGAVRRLAHAGECRNVALARPRRSANGSAPLRAARKTHDPDHERL